MQEGHRLRDVVVGLFVVIGVLIIVFGTFAIRGIGVTSTATYHVRYANVGTLASGSPVKYHGLLVGRLQELEIDPEIPGRIRVTLTIREDVPVTTATIAQVQKADLLGDEYIELRASDAEDGSAAALGTHGEALPPGSYIRAGEPFDLGAALRAAQGIIEELAEILELLRERGESVLVEVGEVVADARGLVSPENRQTIEDALADVAGTARSTRRLVDDNAESVAVMMEQAGMVVERLRIIAENAEGMVAELRPEVRELVGQLRAAVGEAEQTLAQMRGTVEDVDAGRINDLLDSLETATRNLGELSADLKEHPSLLFRSKKADVKGLP